MAEASPTSEDPTGLEDSDAIFISEPGGKGRWRFDRKFLTSNWTCIWGAGCQGILEHPAEDLQQGCCSVGAEIDGGEARLVSALIPSLHPDRFQFHRTAVDDGVFGPESNDHNGWRTRIVDGACIFLNRPGFTGGAGCALHIEADHRGESPIDWKPGVCWQLPVHVNWVTDDDGYETGTLRAWQRRDWGEDGEAMAWCCTEEPAAYVGDTPVIESLAEEIETMVGTPVFIELTRRLQADK